MKVNSKFKIFMQTDLSSSDFKVLALLYQPLVGPLAYSIYNTFYQLSKTEELINHNFMFDILNVQQKEFIENREKLEALGLLDSFIKNKDEYVYILKAPFTAKQFFLDTFLGTYLESEIGETNFNGLVEFFKVNKPVLNHLDNITKNFEDLYEFNSTRLLNLNIEFEGRNGNNSKLIKKSIDYEKFIESLPRALKGTHLFNDNFKQKIIQLAFVYQFDIDQMVEIYTNANKGRKTVTIEQVNLQAKQYFEKLNKELIVTNKEINENNALSLVSFPEIVEKFVVDDTMQKSLALDTINDFINQNEIEQGVLNVLLIFILKNKNGILPHVNYLSKVWQSWSRNGVQTIDDAINYRNTLEIAKSNYTGTKTTAKVNKPDWLDEYLKEISEMEG